MTKQTTFEDDFSKEVWETTYKDHNDNNVDDTFRRVAKAVASVEKNSQLREEWEDKFYDMLSEFKITTGGRIYSNAGTEFTGTTLANCFVGTKPKQDQDSLDGILEVLRAQAKTLKSEGGWGMNFSFIRPRGAFIHGIGVETPGAVKYMELFDKSSDIITAGSGSKSKNKKAKGKIRKGAMMGVLSVWHPDIVEFIEAKLTDGRLTKFNISVNCTNDFMDKVIQAKKLKIESEENPEKVKEFEESNIWELIFPETTHEKYKKEWDGNIATWKNKGYPVNVYRTIGVLELWDKIIKSTYTRNDPGVLFCDIGNKTHCWNYGKNSDIQATNPCGEQLLPFGGICNLASVNLTQFLNKDRTDFDHKKLQKYLPILTRFSDNVNDYSNAPLDEYIDSMRNRRRIGLGVSGWGSALYLLKTRFASEEAETIKARMMKTFTHTVVKASIELAKEKGMFKECDPAKHASSNFWKQINLPQDLIDDIEKYGIRNSALFSIQPTGNTSILANIISGGLEPLFLSEYIRTVIVPSCPEDFKEFVPKYWEGEFKENEYFKLHKEGNDDILKYKHTDGILYKIDKNRGLTKEVLCEDYAVRHLKKTNEWNPDADWAVTTMSLSVDEHVADMSGWGKWIDSSMSKTVNVPNDYPFDKFENLYLDTYKTGYLKGITTYRAGTMTNVLAAKTIESSETGCKVCKREKDLIGDIYHTNAKGVSYFVIVGLDKNGLPYEIFAGKNGFFPKSIETGTIHKVKRGLYQLIGENDNVVIESITEHLEEEEEALTRMISMSLRHGVDINYVVHQLEKVKGALNSLSKCMSRCLKKYIKNGTAVSGEECPACGKETLIRAEGCKKCMNCSNSICG